MVEIGDLDEAVVVSSGAVGARWREVARGGGSEESGPASINTDRR